jgi:predicted RNase H-like nuclease (RuvC/YqgF family)
VREGEYYETNMKDKESIIADLKNRIYMIDKENLELQCKNKNLESRVQKMKEEYEGEVADLN